MMRSIWASHDARPVESTNIHARARTRHARAPLSGDAWRDAGARAEREEDRTHHRALRARGLT